MTNTTFLCVDGFSCEHHGKPDTWLYFYYWRYIQDKDHDPGSTDPLLLHYLCALLKQKPGLTLEGILCLDGGVQDSKLPFSWVAIIRLKDKLHYVTFRAKDRRLLCALQCLIPYGCVSIYVINLYYIVLIGITQNLSSWSEKFKCTVFIKQIRV